MARRVSVVLDRNYGAKLEGLAMKTDVWIVESDANRAAADALWSVAQEWPHISVTIFRAPEVPTEDTWRTLLHQIHLGEGRAEKHASFETIDVIGSEATDEARRVLEGAGFDSISLTREGFRAARAR